MFTRPLSFNLGCAQLESAGSILERQSAPRQAEAELQVFME